jgi:ApaG protein
MWSTMSVAMTQGIRIAVSTRYVPEQSSPDESRFVFAYTVIISNEGQATAQLRTRHWVITDGRGRIEEVRGDGVVGQQPVLPPGESFQYTSGCVLQTPRGTMHGSYRMQRVDGTTFDAEIAPFVLSTPAADTDRVMN